ncbi:MULTISPECIES: hypothetical protein [Arenibacter]|uniref:hypothetical protein n=1 Tax=Arenibacter TaxID=178469 RepID=UPI0012FB5FE6|nr:MULTISPECIES: hypothetical protein [Arenibacter]
MKRKNTPLFILFFDETMTDRVQVNKDGGWAVIVLSSFCHQKRMMMGNGIK